MATMNCCDPSMSLLDQILSDTCQWCSSGDYAAQQTAIQQFGGNAGVPNCDPNGGVLNNIFSNSCNVSVSDLPGQVLGIGNGIPSWVWWVLLAGGGIMLLRSDK